VYGIPADEDVADVDWLELAGARGWVVLMKDERIRYRPAERQALVSHKVMAFCLTSGNLRARQMAELYLASILDRADRCSVSRARAVPLRGVISRHPAVGHRLACQPRRIRSIYSTSGSSPPVGLEYLGSGCDLRVPCGRPRQPGRLGDCAMVMDLPP
jgi:hypothetical protein